MEVGGNSPEFDGDSEQAGEEEEEEEREKGEEGGEEEEEEEDEGPPPRPGRRVKFEQRDRLAVEFQDHGLYRRSESGRYSILAWKFKSRLSLSGQLLDSFPLHVHVHCTLCKCMYTCTYS